jgi:hypothetical protein
MGRRNETILLKKTVEDLEGSEENVPDLKKKDKCH